jgi:hypothetical protein
MQTTRKLIATKQADSAPPSWTRFSTRSARAAREPRHQRADSAVHGVHALSECSAVTKDDGVLRRRTATRAVRVERKSKRGKAFYGCRII